MKTVLIFVISATTHPYRKMIDTQMETWDSEGVDGTGTVYYTGNPAFTPEDYRVVSFPIDEAYATMGHKDLLAYRWALESRPWDYMARVNASCYVHKSRLLEYAQPLPESGLFRGLIVPNHPYCGVSRPFCWGGGQYLISRDVIEAFVAVGDRWRHDVMEDVAMSELAQESGFSLDGNGRCCSINKQPDRNWNCVTYGSPIGGFEFSDFAEVRRLEDQFFFRCKCDSDRNTDAEVMRLLKQYLPA
jgi:hypothetical protein